MEAHIETRGDRQRKGTIRNASATPIFRDFTCISMRALPPIDCLPDRRLAAPSAYRTTLDS